jgi:hypothetical protein
VIAGIVRLGHAATISTVHEPWQGNAGSPACLEDEGPG